MVVELPLDENENNLIKKQIDSSIVMTDSKLYDVSMVNLLGKGNEAFLHKMIALFLKQVPTEIIKMNELAQQQDWEEVSKLAHRMKAAIESMGISIIKTSIREIETRSRGTETITDSELLEIVAFVTHTLKTVFTQLRTAYPEIAQP